MSKSEPAFPYRIEFPPALPISSRADEIMSAIQANPVVILAGETGSGKTTQIPKMCLAAGRGTSGRIACTQPRRVAALSISRRVAEEVNVSWGREVGCKVRFQDQTSAATVVKFLTDGMLLAEVQGDPLLREYDTIIIDEAHERSLNIDFLLGHLRNLRHRRSDLRIIITSATIDTEAFSKAFDGAPVILVEGRGFPVEVIHAPLDSLGSDAAEGDESGAKAEALHYIDGAVEAVERILRESGSGDILVFMPSERDIRETTELLEGRARSIKGPGPEIVPLFGRLSNVEQQRVFSPSQRRKIVIATNIAETSLTIPNIHFVVDTGLARLSRYSPQARTRRLPIEPVAQSSADQRKGRCGRVAEGVCIRLYSEKDYLERPRFATPEIQRANLADVILRMKAFGLGDIERFPFINMPGTKSIRAGYALLDELGALADRDEVEGERTLTALGAELARLPVDPTVGRMVLQARTEKAVREVLIIAAGLSIQDPRDRPLEKQQQADAAHRRFVHRESDFLTLLSIWDSTHGELEKMSQARLRRFCHDHFLSYTRMREWRDIHVQLEETLGQDRKSRPSSALEGVEDGVRGATFGSPAYRAIHRSILAGLLGNIARRDEEGSFFHATHDRRVHLFPGSALFVRDAVRKPAAAPAPKSTKSAKAPRWIMAAEIVETTRLYARTCARLDPAWALDLGAHLVRIAHSEPFWSAEQGRVLVRQRTRLYGLEIDSRSVGYGRINPADATEIFIREGLVEDTVTWPFDFLTHNRKVRAEVESSLSRTRSAGYLNLDEALYRFYAEHLKDVSSVPDLVDLVRERRAAEPRFLMLDPGNLQPSDQAEPDHAAYPKALPLENRAVPLQYTYKPGTPDDGVALDVGAADAELLTEAVLDWAVPGHLEPKVEHYLKSLPKELRRAFIPLTETARSAAARLATDHRLKGGRQTLVEALAEHLRERFRIGVEPSIWNDKPLPDHLRVRVRVLDSKGAEICASRDLPELRAKLRPRSQPATEDVSRRLSAQLESALRHDLAWLERDLRDLRTLGALAATLSPTDELRQQAFGALRSWVTDPRRLPEGKDALSQSDFEAALAKAKADLRGIVPRYVDLLKEILNARQELLVHPTPYPGMEADLAALVPPDFLARTPHERLSDFPRYLRSMLIRAGRWRQNPAKDKERAAELAPFLGELTPREGAGRAGTPPGYGVRRADALHDGRFRWLVEEFRVSLFSQELGTSEPVSAAKLRALLGQKSAGPSTPAAKEPARAPLPLAQKKGAVKSLGALDRLFKP